MLKAYVKLNVVIHLEDEGENPTSNGDLKDLVVAKARIEADIFRSTIKYPLQTSAAGWFHTTDVKGAEVMLERFVDEAFDVMGISHVTGEHKPDLSAAFGGCPETEKPQ